MPNTKLLIFGNPEGGTPLMLAAPSIAIDLTLKILVWGNEQGKVWVSYHSPAYLQERRPGILANGVRPSYRAAKTPIVAVSQRRRNKKGETRK